MKKTSINSTGQAIFASLFIIFTFLLFACSKENDDPIDQTPPTLDIAYEKAFPRSCMELHKGEKYTFRALAEDNFALASYSVSIHHNFDQHTHDKDHGEHHEDHHDEHCTLGEKKTPINPFHYLKSFTIEGSPQEYEITQEIAIPKDVDTGDYHVQISVLDISGWQSREFISIKIVD